MKLEELLKEAEQTIKQLPPDKQQEAVGIIKGLLLSELADKKSA